MSQGKSYNSRQIIKHDDTMDWHDFTSGVWDVLITETSHIYDHLKNGIQPTFRMPPLEQFRIVARRSIPRSNSSNVPRSPAAATPPALM